MGNSSSSNSYTKNQKTGVDWTYKVYFDPHADDADSPIQEYTPGELQAALEEIVEEDEEILNIWVYKCPLSGWQLTQWIFHHQFVVFETNKWWWSIEKNDEGITVQRAKDYEFVKDRYRRTCRNTPVEEMSYDTGCYRLADLVSWLFESDELSKNYHYFADNCKDFAKRVFDQFALSEFH